MSNFNSILRRRKNEIGKTIIIIIALILVNMQSSFAFSEEISLKSKPIEIQETVNIYEATIANFSEDLNKADISIFDQFNIENDRESYIESYDDFLLNLKHTYSAEELMLFFNYSESQAYSILNFDHSEDMRIQSSATLSADLRITQYEYYSSLLSTYVNVRYEIIIQGLDFDQIFTSRKITLGIRGSSSFFHRVNQSLTATYKPMFYTLDEWRGIEKSRSYTSEFYHSQKGVEMTFPSNIYAPVPPHIGYGDMQYYLYKVTANYRGKADYRVGIIDIIGGYAKPSFVGGFSLGLSVTGPTLSLTPGLTTTILHSSIKTCTIGSLICR